MYNYYAAPRIDISSSSALLSSSRARLKSNSIETINSRVTHDAIMVVALVLWSLFATLLTLATYLLVRAYFRSCAFFDRLSIPYLRPKPVFGNVFGVLFHRQSHPALLQQHYRTFAPLPCFGMFELTHPILVVRDLQLAKRLLVRDFDHFTDHRRFHTEREPLLGKSLFLLRGDRWRDMRSTITPAFTGSKMRAMLPFVQQCSGQYVAALRAGAAAPQLAGRPLVVEMKELCNRFATDVIASTAFGVRSDSLAERDNPFYRLGGMECQRFNSCATQLRVAVMTACPRLFELLGLRMFSDEQQRFFGALVHGTIRRREETGERRADMIQLLVEAKRGYLRHEQELNGAAAGRQQEPDDSFLSAALAAEAGDADLCGYQKRFWEEDDITAQCFLFFFTGCETMATLLSFAVQELMEQWPVQAKLIAEIDAVGEQLNGAAYTYDDLVRCKYLDMVVSGEQRA